MYNAIKTKAILERLMAEKNVNQSDIARETGLSTTAISALLKGKLKRAPYPSTINKLARYFGVTPGYILGIHTESSHTPNENDAELRAEVDRALAEFENAKTANIPDAYAINKYVSEAANGSLLLRLPNTITEDTELTIISIVLAERFHRTPNEILGYLKAIKKNR